MVHVYRNLTRKCWSVRKQGKVVDHPDYVLLADCELRVQPAGNAKVREEGRKNVHAYVAGQKVPLVPNPDDIQFKPLTYNPFKYTSFVNAETEQPVHKAMWVWLDADGKAWYA